MPQEEVNGLAVLYAAKSTADKKGSNATQLKDARSLADDDGLKVVGSYADENESAYHGNRGPELAAALDHAERIGGSLIVQHSDRLARGDGVKARHLVQLVLEAKRRGIRLRSKEDDSSLESVLMAAAMGDRNTEDSRRKGAATSKGLKRRRAEGGRIGGMGYAVTWRRNPETDERETEFEPERVPVVVRIYDEYLAGESGLGIVNALNADGLRGARGGKWNGATVRSILTNPVYTGMIRDGDKLIEAKHKGIIPRDRWKEAQRLRKSREQTHRRGRPPLGQHLFRKGFLRCECGAAMLPRTERIPNSGNLYEAYKCDGRMNHRASCSMPNQLRAQLDTSVYSYFEQVGLDLEATRRQLDEAIEHRIAEIAALLAAAEREAAEASGKLARVKDDYLRGDLTAAEWRELRAELQPDAEATESERERLAAQLAQVENGPSFHKLETDLLEKLARIRAAIAGKVTDADGIASARASLMRLFDHFILHRGVPDDGAHLELIGDGYWIEPVINEEAVEGYDEKLRPVLTPKPLEGKALEDAENNFWGSKIHSQPRLSVINPPTSGPTATAPPTVAPHTPNAVARSLPWNSCPIRASEVANIPAPPTPCSPRARLSRVGSLEMPQRNEAKVKMPKPIVKTRRRPIRSPSEPAVSRKAARVSE